MSHTLLLLGLDELREYKKIQLTKYKVLYIKFSFLEKKLSIVRNEIRIICMTTNTGGCHVDYLYDNRQ